ncbi:transglycosylase SLT domain-containing protein [Streptomyces chitinivorans]|uniref:Transglycosylase SLT domain-containing protein n=1 Tax=Streptomyces chitinivorans TaxID=1257027 RepID=A0ABW7HUE4_9ACTN|nr:transglycosylase SLT domain-containing protein [Streptomyces chitinivorans]MDH2407186.1 transglycosylase SLT domain-containing protein [Streptomyces chitinivorans]
MAAGTLVGRGYVAIRPEFEGNWERDARARGTSAGQAGGSGFGAGFGKALGGMLRKTVPLAAASVTQALAPAVGAAGALAPAMLSAAQAGAALRIGMTGVSDAVSAAFDPEKAEEFNEALAKLSPNARAFVLELRSMKPALDKLRLGVQDALFADMDDTLARTAKTTLPVLRGALTESAGALNLMGREVLDTAAGLGKSGALGEAMRHANAGLYNLAGAPSVLLQGLVQVGTAAGPSFERLTQAAGGALERLSRSMTQAFTSGQMHEFIETGFQVLKGLGSILGDALATIGNVLKTSADAGGEVLAVVGELFAELRRVTELPEVQNALRSVFQAVAQIAAALAPVIGAVVRAVAPLLATLAPVVGRLAEQLGPVLVELATTLGRALQPILTALMPVLEVLGKAIVDIVRAVMPLLEPIGRLLAEVVNALMPVLGPIVAIVVRLVETLSGPLTTIINALIPVVEMLGGIFAQVMKALQPLIDPILNLLDELLPIVAELARVLISQLLAAVRPLLPVFGNLLGLLVRLALDVMAQLRPSLDRLIDAGLKLFTAVVPLLPMLGRLVAVVLELAIKAIVPLLPPLLRLTTFLADVVARVLATVIGWVAKLVTWLTGNLGPAFRWLNDKVIQPVFKAISSVISWWWRNVVQRYFGLVKFALQTLGAVFRALYNKAVKPALGWVADRFRWLYDKAVRPVMGWIGDRISWVWENVIKKAFDALKRAVGKVKDAFSDAKDGIGRAWDGIKNATRKPINWVIRVVWNDGIVGTWKKIGEWIPGLPKLKKLPLLAAGGPMPVQPGVFNRPTAIVGEGNPRHPEYVIPTDPRYRKRALALHAAAGSQLLAEGGIIGKVRGAIASAADFLTDPVRSLGKLLSPLLDKLRQVAGSPWGRMAAGLPRLAVDGLKDLVKDKVGDFLGGPAGPVPGGAGVRRWTGVVRQALALVGQPLAHTGITLRRMNQESGGNPRAVNLWDINARLGHPSVGLMQVIRPTFRAHAGRFRNKGPKMYGVSIDPLANIYASMRYALSRYGSLPRAYNRPGGYDDGGWLMPGATLAVNSIGQPEAVLTPGQWRTMRAAAEHGGLQPGQPVVLQLEDGPMVRGWVRGIADESTADGFNRLHRVLRAGRRH